MTITITVFTFFYFHLDDLYIIARITYNLSGAGGDLAAKPALFIYSGPAINRSALFILKFIYFHLDDL